MVDRLPRGFLSARQNLLLSTLAVVVSTAPLAGCGDSAKHNNVPAPTSQSEALAKASSSPATTDVPAAKVPFSPSHPNCETVDVFASGAPFGSVCVDDVAQRGLTILDLSNEWTPVVFAVDPATHDAPEYRSKYLELASLPNADLGLYGIAPTMTVLANRLSDETRRTCRASIDLVPLKALGDAMAAAADDRTAAALVKKPEAKPAILALQAELACAGLLSAQQAKTGTMSSSTQIAIDAFRRRHMIVAAGTLDVDTVTALSQGGDELDFRGLLRGLRERVADAAGLIEDGSASEEQVAVVDRKLDLSRFAPITHDALPGGAPDLVDAATDAAARDLGWTSPDAARKFLTARGKDGLQTLRVAVALPAAPTYHSKMMDLRVEIDRGDVFYEMPGQAAAERKKMGAFRGPSFVIYAKDGDHDVPLVRWATTIGGWKKERNEDGDFELKYKESDVGERVWRRIVAAPAWMPPDSTPETDLLHEAKDGSLTLKRDLIQPGFRNAYGLVMLIHDEPVKHGSETTWVDHGIRTHGSVDYRSIQRGESHGCHRLYNQLALRLSGFVLEHRDHVRRGKMASGYHRTLDWKDQTVDVDVPTRGYLYEVDPPVPVRVLEGRIVGEAQKPLSRAIPIKTDSQNAG